MPKSEIATADELRELEGFLRQSHITTKNLRRLDVLGRSGVREVAEAAALLKEIGKRYPYKRRRFKKMSRSHPDLMRRLGDLGLIEPWTERVDDDDDWGIGEGSHAPTDPEVEEDPLSEFIYVDPLDDEIPF